MGRNFPRTTIHWLSSTPRRFFIGRFWIFAHGGENNQSGRSETAPLYPSATVTTTAYLPQDTLALTMDGKTVGPIL